MKKIHIPEHRLRTWAMMNQDALGLSIKDIALMTYTDIYERIIVNHTILVTHVIENGKQDIYIINKDDLPKEVYFDGVK